MLSFLSVTITLFCAQNALAGNLDGPNTLERRAPKVWKLSENLKGQSFVDAFNFETGADPNGGASTYISQAEARSNGMLKVGKNAVTMRVDTTKSVNARKSLRISSKKYYNQGLFIHDIAHAPQGCGVWPAAWMVGDDWPNGGEIDIMEYVNSATQNSMSLHTGSGRGCNMSPNGFSAAFMMHDTSKQANCAAYETDNQGCGLRDPAKNTAGWGFNKNGGGVYATLWTDDAISIWFFPRNKIPADIRLNRPNPAKWGKPRGRWSGFNVTACVKPQRFVLNTLLCGTWASSVWSDPSLYAGQKDSCAVTTKTNSCEAFVLNNGNQFNNAYWTINSLKIYN